MPSPDFGQLLINTTDNKATETVCRDFEKRYRNTFPNAHIKWKILALQPGKYPIEIRISGDSIADLREVEAKVDSIARPVEGLEWIRSDWEQKQQNVSVQLDRDKSTRMLRRLLEQPFDLEGRKMVNICFSSSFLPSTII